MYQYKEVLKDVLYEGVEVEDRTGVGTIKTFGHMMKFDMEDGFPLLTLKYTNFNAIKAELAWFLRGETNIETLDSTIWNEWADEKGHLGPIYGYQWRHGFGIDQLQNLINDITNNPNSRRLMVTAWNPADIPRMALPPCHHTFQCNVIEDKLHMMMHQRSADMFLGVPFNIASYALLLHILCRVTDLKPGVLTITLGDAHIYKNHVEQASILLQRNEKPLPRLDIPHISALYPFERIDVHRIRVEGYSYHPALKGDIAV